MNYLQIERRFETRGISFEKRQHAYSNVSLQGILLLFQGSCFHYRDNPFATPYGVAVHVFSKY